MGARSSHSLTTKLDASYNNLHHDLAAWPLIPQLLFYELDLHDQVVMGFLA
jgi:hypothetical protein